MENKRLFFGFEVSSPWPEEMPPGRILLEEDRHVTLLFLGNADLPRLLETLSSIPPIPFKIGLSGVFDQPIFLPKDSPHVAAWEISWLEGEALLNEFQKDLASWLQEAGFLAKDLREFLPHVTIARDPEDFDEWSRRFEKRPLFIKSLSLFESLGSSRYRICWQQPILPPFEEKEHTADIAFTIRGASLQNLHLHAQLALSFHCPFLLDYFSFEEISDLDQIIRSLNFLIGKVDQIRGSPFKAVSYHGGIEEKEMLEWEMIVDV